jgi:spore coat polysaccharide biosynthesis protein SpsF (cytidylyltransferase family)/2-polyprenyl-3-methyl-5-hydroxy-6-metoxy-1,4-benzoquinol methylase/spore coat polysaccharide biosynthesis predicted glycosyltransferase SpsG
MTIVVVQCRISSTRLPGKAVKLIGGKPLLAWTLDAMKKVPADGYFVATDAQSEQQLKPIAAVCNWDLFVGPLEDVLKRFCLLVEKTGADTIVRATADNPFLFYEAAQALLNEYRRRSRVEKCDYITWSGLPHGSGIEILNAASLLKAESLTNLPYDHEHVGPSLYKHPDIFTSHVLKAPSRWNHPEFRTTIDTTADYRRALQIVQFLSDGAAPSVPYTTEQILSALHNPVIANPVLLVPSTKKGHGTGHLRRCLSAAGKKCFFVYIPEHPELEGTQQLIHETTGLTDWQIVRELPDKSDYALIVTDLFSMDENDASRFFESSVVASIDEGSSYTRYTDFLLDIIPSFRLERKPNLAAPALIPLPHRTRQKPHVQTSRDFEKILVMAGGEDPADLVIPAALAFALPGKQVTAICQRKTEAEKRIAAARLSSVRVVENIPNLKESLADYDLVVTHYGFTAFEATAAGCAVLLLATTPLHAALAGKYGFRCLRRRELTTAKVRKYLESPELLYPASVEKLFSTEIKDSDTLPELILRLAGGKRLQCPVCRRPSSPADTVVARTPEHTFRRCAACGTLFMSWTMQSSAADYGSTYFNELYKKQYGKTYLEDFTSIKTQCVRRTSVLDALYRRRFHAAVTPSVLDIGCAYGPFLDAAADSGWQVFGTDISDDAVNYVQNTLLFPAVCCRFPAFDPSKEFGIRNFDAVTMWYVIEHFIDLDAALKKVSEILKKDGLFAFSTPSASGVSGRFSTGSFFEASPADHYTLLEPGRIKAILERYGFRVIKILSTGHHPERFPLMKKYGWPVKSAAYRMLSTASHFFHLGDTFEVYCRKEKEIG